MSFAGIYPILFSFFDARGNLDEAAMRRQIAVCADGPAQGVAALGLATEVSKLSAAEKRCVIDWTLAGVGGAKPVAITISGDSVAAQVELATYAAERGANWLILQPPRGRAQPEAYYFDFFAAVMEQARLPCAIQNAPEYLGVGLSPQSIAMLARERANFALLKGEGPAVLIREVIAANPRLAVFNGRGGLELIENLAAGCAGMVIGVDSFDWQARIFAAVRAGRADAADELYRVILPGIVFMMASVEHLTCYGKRIAARRLGLVVHDRAPALAPTPFGLEQVAIYADRLGSL